MGNGGARDDGRSAVDDAGAIGGEMRCGVVDSLPETDAATDAEAEDATEPASPPSACTAAIGVGARVTASMTGGLADGTLAPAEGVFGNAKNTRLSLAGVDADDGLATPAAVVLVAQLGC